MIDAAWWNLFWHNFWLQAMALGSVGALVVGLLSLKLWSDK